MDRQRAEQYPLHRREVAAKILEDRGDMLVVSGLGAPSNDVNAVGDQPLNMPLWGAMGGAVMTGLGLAIAQPDRRVLVITGDGDMLMGIGSLATVAIQAPANLAIVVEDNERYGETGMQETHTAGCVDLEAMAKAAGIPVTGTVRSDNELGAALPIIRSAVGPVFYNIKVLAEALPFSLPPREGAHLKDRFRLALLGPGAIF